MNKRTFNRIFEYTSTLPRTTPQLESGQDRRDLGRYSIPEAAVYISVPERTMRRWFLGDHRILTPSYLHERAILLSFFDVTEAYIIESLRTYWGFNPRKLREALARLRTSTRFSRPLLRKDLSVIPEFQNLIATFSEKGRRVHVDMAHDGNLVFDEFAQTMAMRIDRDSKGKPVRIFPGADARSNVTPVSMDPDVMSGELVITGTRIPAASIYAKKLAGKSADQIADSYHLSRDLIRKVIQHFEPEKP
jgi:uncharacterized protein (DUF433 family)